MIQEKDIDLIEKYLEGDLQGPESKAFQRRVQEDPEFKLILEEMETMVSGIRYTGRKKIQSDLQKLEESLPSLRQERETKVVAMRRFRIWAAAASVLLVAVTAIWLFTGRQLNQDQLFTAYYQPYQNVESPTTRGETNQDVRKNAYMAYDQERFEEAVNLFGSIPAEESQPVDDFYEALSYLSLDQGTEAAALLVEFIDNGDDIMKERASWYLALAHLNQGKIDQCKEVLRIIVEEQTYNHPKASSLLEQLD